MRGVDNLFAPLQAFELPDQDDLILAVLARDGDPVFCVLPEAFRRDGHQILNLDALPLPRLPAGLFIKSDGLRPEALAVRQTGREGWLLAADSLSTHSNHARFQGSARFSRFAPASLLLHKALLCVRSGAFLFLGHR